MTIRCCNEEGHYSDGVVDYLGLKFENGDIKQCKNQKLIN